MTKRLQLIAWCAFVVAVSLPSWLSQPLGDGAPIGREHARHVEAVETHAASLEQDGAWCFWDSRGADGWGDPRGQRDGLALHVAAALLVDWSGLSAASALGVVCASLATLGLAVTLLWIRQRQGSIAALWGGVVLALSTAGVTLTAFLGLAAYGAAASLTPVVLYCLQATMGGARGAWLGLSVVGLGAATGLVLLTSLDCALHLACLLGPLLVAEGLGSGGWRRVAGALSGLALALCLAAPQLAPRLLLPATAGDLEARAEALFDGPSGTIGGAGGGALGGSALLFDALRTDDPAASRRRVGVRARGSLVAGLLASLVSALLIGVVAGRSGGAPVASSFDRYRLPFVRLSLYGAALLALASLLALVELAPGSALRSRFAVPERFQMLLQPLLAMTLAPTLAGRAERTRSQRWLIVGWAALYGFAGALALGFGLLFGGDAPHAELRARGLEGAQELRRRVEDGRRSGAWCWRPPGPSGTPEVEAPSGVQVRCAGPRGQLRSFSIVATSRAQVRLKTFAWPGWSLAVVESEDPGGVSLLAARADDRLGFEVPAGRHRIELDARGAWPFALGDGLAAGAVLATLALLFQAFAHGAVLTFLGHILVVVALIGTVLPLLPTTPLLLLALCCYSRGDERLKARLLEHPRFGPYLVDWQSHGVIRRRSKVAALSLIGVSFSFPLVIFPLSFGARSALAVLGVAVCAFIVSRPAEPPDSVKAKVA